MKITNHKKMNHSAWGVLGFLMFISSIYFFNAIQIEIKLTILCLALFISILFLQITAVELKSTANNIIIKKKHPLFGKKQIKTIVKIPKKHLEFYHINEKILGYELILMIKKENGLIETIKIQLLGFSWKMIIRMIKSLENAKRSSQYAREF